jgi:hypothetical protein
MYACACRARYGARALAIARDNIDRLKGRGDDAGADIRTKVAAHIAELYRTPHHV